ncbi:hypothetical protein [Thalassoroseus pseudoceratinae]|uniref:hypothetical protein n=1 Tax=Thalassoroseus pseudoceratinae TaxID=2713176 RepID=UPI00141F22CC|nr:hypothetical protein [Thalassoroseus pseudoceratinae]
MIECSAKRKWLSVLAALAVMGVVFAVVEAVYPVFTLSEKFDDLSSDVPAEVKGRYDASFIEVETRNTAFVAAMASLGLAVTLSICTCCCRVGWGKAIGLTILGAVISLACGVGGGFAGSYLMQNETESIRDLKGILQAHAAMVAMAGLGAGLARSFVVRGWKAVFSSIVGGVVGGGLAGVCYVMCMSTLLPGEKVEFLVASNTIPRAVWFASTALLVSMCIVFSDNTGSQSQPTSSDTAENQPESSLTSL